MSKMHCWVVYHRPKDIDANYVVREQWYTGATGRIVANAIARSADTLEEVRKFIPAGLTRIERSPQDDPVIVETWI